MFGSQTYDMRPDIMTMSKQLSSSYLPISAFMINEKVYGPIADESHRIGVLGHGFTAGGHPVASAVALENLKIIEERDLVANAREMGERLRGRFHALEGHPLVGEVRGVGLIAAVELVTNKEAKTALEAPGALGGKVAAALQARGVIVRNMLDAIAFCPPLIIKADEVDMIADRFEAVLNDVAAEVL
jgi:4-aminobutyrate--pyruvate transaminase